MISNNEEVIYGYQNEVDHRCRSIGLGVDSNCSSLLSTGTTADAGGSDEAASLSEVVDGGGLAHGSAHQSNLCTRCGKRSKWRFDLCIFCTLESP